MKIAPMILDDKVVIAAPMAPYGGINNMFPKKFKINCIIFKYARISGLFKE